MQRAAANALLDLRYGSVLALKPGSGGPLLKPRNSDYAVLAKIFDGRIRPDDVLVDVGCATGRVINHWIHHGCRNRIIGVESNIEAAARAARRLAKYPNVEILAGDVVANFPADGSLFYLFNPFGREVMAEFADVAAAQQRDGRRLVLIYYNCKHVDVFEDDDRWEVERVELDAPRYAQLSPLAVIVRR